MSGPSTQPDPIGLAGGLNLYGYTDGDPINKSDPFGLSPLAVLVRVGAAIARHWRAIATSAAAARVASQSPTVAQLADDALEATKSIAQQGPRVMQVGRHIGERLVGQGRAVEALETAISRFADRGPTVGINNVQYLLAGRGNPTAGIDALAVTPGGAVTRAVVRMGDSGWELVRNLGSIATTP